MQILKGVLVLEYPKVNSKIHADWQLGVNFVFCVLPVYLYLILQLNVYEIMVTTSCL